MSHAAELELGHVAGVFGVRGEVKLYLHNPGSGLLARGREVALVAPDGTRRTARLRSRSGAGKRLIGAIEGVADRDAAEALVGHRILVPVASLPAPAADEFYVHAVLGAEVVCDGARVGRVREVHDQGPTTVLEVALDAGGAGYVPVLATHVLELDTARRRVVVAAGALAVDDA